MSLSERRPVKYDEAKKSLANAVNIAVMGVTGTGKTTFTNLASGAHLKVWDSLASCTQEVQAAPSFQLDKYTINLIDTPGFDDTDRSEVQILKKIASYLEEQYSRKVALHGVIYLHSIDSPRMGGVSKRAFGLFRKMCGSENLKNVSIVTTRWSKVEAQQGEARAKELAEVYFKPALDEGAKMYSHDDTQASADQLLRTFLGNPAITLSLPKELVDDLKPIFNTEAGIHVESDLKELIKRAGGEGDLGGSGDTVSSSRLEQYRHDEEEIRKSRAGAQLGHDEAPSTRISLPPSAPPQGLPGALVLLTETKRETLNPSNGVLSHDHRPSIALPSEQGALLEQEISDAGSPLGAPSTSPLGLPVSIEGMGPTGSSGPGSGSSNPNLLVGPRPNGTYSEVAPPTEQGGRGKSENYTQPSKQSSRLEPQTSTSHTMRQSFVGSGKTGGLSVGKGKVEAPTSESLQGVLPPGLAAGPTETSLGHNTPLHPVTFTPGSNPLRLNENYPCPDGAPLGLSLPRRTDEVPSQLKGTPSSLNPPPHPQKAAPNVSPPRFDETVSDLTKALSGPKPPLGATPPQLNDAGSGSRFLLHSNKPPLHLDKDPSSSTPSFTSETLQPPNVASLRQKQTTSDAFILPHTDTTPFDPATAPFGSKSPSLLEEIPSRPKNTAPDPNPPAHLSEISLHSNPHLVTEGTISLPSGTRPRSKKTTLDANTLLRPGQPETPLNPNDAPSGSKPPPGTAEVISPLGGTSSDSSNPLNEASSNETAPGQSSKPLHLKKTPSRAHNDASASHHSNETPLGSIPRSHPDEAPSTSSLSQRTKAALPQPTGVASGSQHGVPDETLPRQSWWRRLCCCCCC